MSDHVVDVYDGAEYQGETYIRCLTCNIIFDDAHQGLEALIVFLRQHGAIQ